ncbi:MAG: hypothetical protein ACPGYT_08915 [Nitrospirales bacterium]
MKSDLMPNPNIHRSPSPLVSLTILIFAWTLADAVWSQPLIHVEVLEPSLKGQEVGIRTEVKGKATVPSDYFLWILVHRIEEQEKSWWPQGQVEIDPQTFTWSKKVKFGEERDIGYQFEIAVITVSKEEHEKLSRYWFMVKNTGRSSPIKMPMTAIPPTYKIVKKVSH